MSCSNTEQSKTDSSLDTQIRVTNSTGHTVEQTVRSWGSEERATVLSASPSGG